MADKERQQHIELQAAEAELDAEQAEQIKHVTKNANDDMSKSLKQKHKDLLMQVWFWFDLWYNWRSCRSPRRLIEKLVLNKHLTCAVNLSWF